MIKIIELIIGSESFECEVRFNFTKGYPAKVNDLPENCYPEVYDEYELLELDITTNNGIYQTKHKCDWLINALEDNIIKALVNL